MKYICRSNNQSGFTLIEMAVVVVIVGIVISIMATVLPSLIQSAKISKAKAILEKVDYALQGYSMANNRLPFADAECGTTDGNEDDGLYIGNLPYKTLGISSADDVWGNPIKYGVYSTLTATFADATAFCTAISSAGTAAKSLSEVYTTTDESCPGTTNNISNQAYVIASGGPKDLDVANAFFDLCNGETGAGFNAPNRIQSTTYDDLVRAFALNELNYKNCTGGDTPPGPSTGVENTEALCTDDIDNDGDGKKDCHDQDCCGHDFSAAICPHGCPPSDDVKITTTPDPITDGIVGQTNYSHTFQATGGSGYYYWYLDSIAPAISGLSLSLSGNLSGTINVCEGAYTVNITVVDQHDSSRTDSNAFTLNVNNGSLSITPDSTGYSTSDPNFTVDSSTFSHKFTISGSHVGDFDWALNWVGTDPGGFQVDGESGCEGKFWKSSSTTEGTYTFTLTATDSTCSANTKTTNSYTIKITGSGTGAPYSADLVAEWHMDECSWDGTAGEVKDSGDLFLNGTAQNGADTTGAGKICSAGDFDGTNDYISVDSTDELKQTAAFSIALWVKVNADASEWVRLAGKGNSSKRNYGLWLATNGTILFQIYSNGSNGNAQTTMTVNDGNWHHVVGVYDFSTMKVYIDNVERKSINYSRNPRTSDDPFTMGYAGFHTYLNGCLDEVMLLHKALPATSETETSVDTIYNLTRSSCSGTCYTEPVAEYRMDEGYWTDGVAEEVKDSSGNNHHGTPHGHAAINSEDKHLCRAGEFSDDDDDDGYIDITGLSDISTTSGDQTTVTFWMKWLGGDSEMPIGWMTYDLWLDDDDGDCFGFNTGNGDIYGITGASAKLANNWRHIAAVFTNNNTTANSLYIDGEEQSLSTVRGTTHGNRTAGSNLRVSGWLNNTSYCFNGLIDELKIYNRALAENEIKADKDKTRDCSEFMVTITTTDLNDGVINSAYTSNDISAAGGAPPYGWQILLTNPISGLDLDSHSGQTVHLTGTINECAGNYNYKIKVTDGAGNTCTTEQDPLVLTVKNGTLGVSPSAPKTFNCTTSDFYRDFSVTGQRMGSLENWNIDWLSANPGGFEVIKTGDATVRFRKNGTSTTGNDYSFKLTANDSTCTDNTIDSGYYTLNVSDDGTGTPYYAGRQGEWWLDEESGQITDYSGNGNHGTASGGVTYDVQGKVWTALQFNGSSGYVDCGNDNSLDIDTNPADVPQDFTVAAWVKPAVAPQTSAYFVDKGTGNLFDGYGLALLNSRFSFITDGNGASGGKTTLSADADATFDTWYHVVGVREGGVKKLYINKALQSSTPTDSRELSNTSRPLYIARAVNDGGYFNGVVDEVSVYTRALSQDEITDLYNQASLVAYYKMDETEGNIYDYSGQANHGTNYGAEYGVDGQVGTALDFDGTDYVNVGSSADLRPADISISVWAKASQIDTWNGIITNKQGAADGINLQMGTAQRIAALVGDGTACNYVISTTVPVVGTWYHVVITHNSADNNNILYVNGTNEKEVVRALSYTAGGTIIGRFYRPSLPFKGAIDEVKIYNRVLSADEVTDLYNKGIEEGG